MSSKFTEQELSDFSLVLSNGHTVTQDYGDDILSEKLLEILNIGRVNPLQILSTYHNGVYSKSTYPDGSPRSILVFLLKNGYCNHLWAIFKEKIHSDSSYRDLRDIRGVVIPIMKEFKKTDEASIMEIWEEVKNFMTSDKIRDDYDWYFLKELADLGIDSAEIRKALRDIGIENYTGNDASLIAEKWNTDVSQELDKNFTEQDQTIKKQNKPFWGLSTR